MRPSKYYDDNWDRLKVLPEFFDRLKKGRGILLGGRKQYELVSSKIEIPWYVVGVIHCMEAWDEDLWKGSLHNGMPWDEVNAIIPSGPRGPFQSWEEAALDALSLSSLPHQWTVSSISRFLEDWNSSYENLNVNSPYLYYGSNIECLGKFKRGIGFVRYAENRQIGSLVILKSLVESGDISPISKNNSFKRVDIDHRERRLDFFSSL